MEQGASLKAIVPQLLKISPAFSGTRRFITVSTRDGSYPEPNESSPHPPNLFQGPFIVIFFSHQPNGLFLSDFSIILVYISRLPHAIYMPSTPHSFLFDRPVMFGEEYEF
jgi:hypothetical protein